MINSGMSNSNFQKYLSIISTSFGSLPRSLPKPLLVVLVGLPATGKTFLSHNLKERFPLVLLHSDKIRIICFPKPKYTKSENKYVFDICHRLIKDLLKRRMPVLFDATNLLEKHRQVLYDISRSINAKLMVLNITADKEMSKRRISERLLSNSANDFSKATWDVYKRMARFNDPISVKHWTIDNSTNNIICLDPIIEELVSWRNSLYP